MTAEFAGALTQRVTVMRRAATRDALGGAAGGWTAVAACWARIVPDGHGAAAAAGAVDAQPRWRATVRRPCDVGVGDRLDWDGRRIAVRRIAADPRTPDRIDIHGEEER